MMKAIKSKLQNWIPFKSGKARIEQLLILTDSKEMQISNFH